MDVSQASPGLERSLSPDAIEPIPPPSPGSEFSGSLESMKDMTSQNGFAPEASPHPETPTVSAAHIRQNHVGTVLLHGVHIVSLVIDNKERLCLAQISNTLLKDFSYNEIHNRRVALGITCVQCTPVQLEILRRAGAMPISSRRCGMITKREAERLVKSFLDDTTPPKLPENFAFKVKHSCGWGCRGEFMPSRYNSSRAKCIKCTYCNMFFSPNKFIFHFHRNHDSKYHHPDAANFNSWRRHLKLDYDKNVDELEFAWEDVKAMFNGGSRKRLLTPSQSKGQSSPPEVSMKRSRSDLQEEGMSKLPSLSYPYPVMPMSNVSCANMAGYMARPPHPAFPFPTSEQQPSYPTPDNSKMNNNFADFWKNKNSAYCNPFGFLWAKNFGLLNDPVSLNHYRNVIDLSRPSSQKHSPSMEERMMVPEERRMNGHSREEGHWRTSKSPVMERKPETDSSYFSAFKPVSRDINLAFERRPTVSSSPLDEKELWSDRAQSVTSDNSGGGIESFGDPEETDINVTDIDQTELLKSTSEEVTDNKCVMVMQNSESETVISHTDKNKNNTRSQEEKKDANSKDESGKLSLVKDKSRPHEQASIEKIENESPPHHNNTKDMTTDELKAELQCLIEERKRAEKEYQVMIESFQEKSKHDVDYREDMKQQMQTVKDSLYQQIDQEKKAKHIVQEKLKEAYDALHQFSSKMVDLRSRMEDPTST